MQRRHLLQSFLAASAAASAAQSPARPLASEEYPKLTTSSFEAAAAGIPRFFSPRQLEALGKLCDAIFPAANGRPGAARSGVPEFLDFLVGQSPAPVQSLYREGLNRIASEGAGPKTLAPLSEAWTYQGPGDRFAQFLQRAKADIFQATINSREWAESLGRGSRGSAPSGYFWRSLD